ncbi:3D domain-containing protein [Paenibacillus sp. HWE-109]|uniref:3D domain-containing protein n=1 Tax=Paenibacillus sp. HWE-109 TaxID=1306526 RepID=UPI001EDEF229|nr:3D domain-containing protein [Paenibacillus sp. HWE-109]UKS30185.1 3D domain-containing protein [Paenibacillus sp. HWE-109]
MGRPVLQRTKRVRIGLLVALMIALMTTGRELPPEPTQSDVKYEVTAYTNSFQSTGKRPGDRGYGITASGKKTEEGVTAACGPDLAFGTRVEIPELGRTYTCQDRGGAIKDGHIDVYMTSEKRAKQFGRQTLSVKIIPPSSGKGASK